MNPQTVFSAGPLPRWLSISAGALVAVGTVFDLPALLWLGVGPAHVAWVVLLAAVSLGAGWRPTWAAVVLWLLLVWSPAAQGPAAAMITGLWVTFCVLARASVSFIAVHLLVLASYAFVWRWLDLVPQSQLWVEAFIGALITLTGGLATRYLLRQHAVTQRARAERAEAEQNRIDAERRRRESEERQAAELASARREERLSLARDLHDVVASQLTAVAVSVAGAKRSPNPDDWRACLTLVDTATTAALDELRTLLGVLRSEGAPAQPREHHAPPSASVSSMVDNLRALGRTVTLTLDADALDSSPAAAPTIVRVVREALTNVIRHADPSAPAEVVVRGADQSITVTISNVIAAVAPDHSGAQLGLVGLAEAVAAQDGTWFAGPREGTWVVEAELPRPQPS